MNRFFKGLLGASILSVTLTSVAYTQTAFVIEGYGAVERVIDGDTFDIRAESQSVVGQLMNQAPRVAYQHLNGSVFRLRLASVDTAESVHPDASRNSPKGLMAKRAVSGALEDALVHFRCFDFGKYGRAICNLEVKNRELEFDLGEALIRSGYSRYVQKWGNNPFMHERYLAADKLYNKGKK